MSSVLISESRKACYFFFPEVLWIEQQKQVSHSRQTVIFFGLELFMFLAANFIHSIFKVLRNMASIVYDFGLWQIDFTLVLNAYHMSILTP